MERVKGVLSSTGSLSGKLSGTNSLTATLAIKVLETDAHQKYSGETTVIPATSEIVLNTANTIVADDILVKEIPTFETSNEFGVSFIIAS